MGCCAFPYERIGKIPSGLGVFLTDGIEKTFIFASDLTFRELLQTIGLAF